MMVIQPTFNKFIGEQPTLNIENTEKKKKKKS